jgi:hypothetical protein
MLFELLPLTPSSNFTHFVLTSLPRARKHGTLLRPLRHEAAQGNGNRAHMFREAQRTQP